MARLLLIASLVGARGASGLALTGDPEGMQMLKTTPEMSKDELGRIFFILAGVRVFPHTPFLPQLPQQRTADSDLKRWLFMLVPTGTSADLQTLCGSDMHPTALMTNPDIGELPICEGRLTDQELASLLMNYQHAHPGLIELIEEDVFQNMVPEAPPTALSGHGVAAGASYPWNIVDLHADQVRGRGVGVNVFVLDTGIRITHNEFGGRAFAGVDLVSTGTRVVCNPTNASCAADDNWHGTHCAGTVGSQTYGVADGATLFAAKVLDELGVGAWSWIVDAEQWVFSSGARPAVVSMSLGSLGSGTNFVFHQTSLDALVNDGVTVVVSAGNQNADACNYNPAWIPSVITVASYAQGGGKSGFSNYGTCIDVWAPGTSIVSATSASDTAVGSADGTSQACPHVSGLAAIMYEAYPTAVSMTAPERWALITASQRTGYVTGVPPTPASVNLVALAPTPTPSPPTMSPTPATPAPSLNWATAVGDPHLQNVHGERFDLTKSGMHDLLIVPRGMSAENALLRVQADARRMGGHCADMYFQEVNITGSWAEAKQAGGYHFVASQRTVKSPEWLAFGPISRKVQVRVVGGRTQGGLEYLNFYVKHLGRLGLAIGGLLGEDDHKDASIASANCGREMTLAQGVEGGELAHAHGPSVSSVAVAGFD